MGQDNVSRLDYNEKSGGDGGLFLAVIVIVAVAVLAAAVNDQSLRG